VPDLSNLKLVEEEIVVADDASYVDASEFPPPIPSGIYTFIQGKPEFTATAGGFLQATMTHVVAGGEQDGAKLGFDRVSDKPFERSGVRVSMAGIMCVPFIRLARGPYAGRTRTMLLRSKLPKGSHSSGCRLGRWM